APAPFSPALPGTWHEPTPPGWYTRSMFEWSAEGGLAALFTAAFVSATVLPANSEIVLLAFLKAFPQRLPEALLVATLGNTLGGLTTYWIGRLLPQRRLPPERALAWVRSHGAFALVLS